eukprot:3622060-Amphidinium_carterae.2
MSPLEAKLEPSPCPFACADVEHWAPALETLARVLQRCGVAGAIAVCVCQHHCRPDRDWLRRIHVTEQQACIKLYGSNGVIPPFDIKQVADFIVHWGVMPHPIQQPFAGFCREDVVASTTWLLYSLNGYMNAGAI